jgi:hypothetical protein
MQIIVRDKRSENERRKKEDNAAILKFFYKQECENGGKVKLPCSKARAKKLYEER